MIFYTLDTNNKKIYTMKEESSYVAIPAKFSIEDKNSEYRITIKERFNIPPFDN